MLQHQLTVRLSWVQGSLRTLQYTNVPHAANMQQDVSIMQFALETSDTDPSG